MESKKLKSEGKADRRGGEVKQTLEHATEKVEEVIDLVGDIGEKAIGKIKDGPNAK